MKKIFSDQAIFNTFFTILYEHTDGLIEIRPKPYGRRAFFEKSDHAGMERHIRRNMDQNVFFGVATRDGQAGRKDNIVNFPAVWDDVDYKDTSITTLGENLKHFLFKPSIILLSGGGAHLYWLLNEPAEQSDIEAVEDVNRRIAHALGGDQNATEAARVLRVPSTLNHKYTPPRPVKLHRIEKFEYSLEDFSDLPQPPANKSSKKSSVTLEPVEHGERNATLTRIAGKYIGRGNLSKEEVLDLCLGWNCRCPEPQPMADVLATVNSIIATHKRNQNGDPNREESKRINFSIV